MMGGVERDIGRWRRVGGAYSGRRVGGRWSSLNRGGGGGGGRVKLRLESRMLLGSGGVYGNGKDVGDMKVVFGRRGGLGEGVCGMIG
jgi:hypothetical protein